MKSKKMEYNVKLPQYSTPQFSYLFEKKKNYNFKKDKIRKLNNVFLSNTGIVLVNGFIPFSSAENLVGKEDHTFYLKHYKKVLEQYFVSKYGNSLNSIKLESKTLYFSIHTPWFGYFSWVTTYLPRLLEFFTLNLDAVLVYPEEWDKFDFVKQSLDFFPNLKMTKIPSDHHVFIEEFLLIPCRRWTSHFNKEAIIGVRDFFNDAYLNSNIKTFENVYISRGKAKRRKIINEEELLFNLKKFNITPVFMEDYSFIEQVYLMQNTKVLIGLHGAGMTNVNFLKKNAKVLEFTPILTNFINFRFPFWRMSNLLDLDYYCIFCEKTSETEDEYDSDVIINLDEVNKISLLLFKN